MHLIVLLRLQGTTNIIMRLYTLNVKIQKWSVNFVLPLRCKM